MQSDIASRPGSDKTLSGLFWHAFSFMVGATVEIEFEFVGTLRISELILLAYFVLMTIRGRITELFSIPFAKPLASLGLLWLLAQLISDSVNGVSQVNSLKGIAMIGMILVSIAGAVLLIKPDPNRYAAYLLGLFCSRIYDTLFGTLDTFGSQEYWDVHVAGWAGTGMILTSLFLLNNRFRVTVPLVLLVMYGCVAIAFSSRSHGMVFIMTGLGLWYGCSGREINFHGWRGKRILSGAVTMGLAFFVLFYVFVYFGLRGDLGAGTRRQLLRSGNPYNPVAVLIAGRGSVPVALRAISDRPVIGHGSRAYNPKYATPTSRLHGIKVIPAHSCLLSAWVFAGILSFPFWLVVLVIHGRILVTAINFGHAQFVLLSAYLFTDGLWNILFSPLGYARFPWPPLLAVNVILYQRAVEKWRRHQSYAEPASSVDRSALSA